MKRIISITLCMAMMASVGAVSAADVEDGYVTVATVYEDLGDGLTLRKDLAMKPSLTRGFSGTKYSSVTHTYIRTGTIKATITAYATFSSAPNQNVCYLDAHSNSVYNIGDSFNTITAGAERTWSNEGMGILSRYAKYELDYWYSNSAIKTSPLWVKCEADGDPTNSGNQTDDRSIEPNQVIVGDTVISFG